MVLVIEDDKHYSLTRIARNSIINVSDAESVEQISEMLLTYSERLNRLIMTYGFTIGYNVCRFQRLFRVFKQLLNVERAC